MTMTRQEWDELDLPPTQHLALEVLIARYRLGEQLWTFSSKCRPALDKLGDLDLAHTMHGIVENTVRASLSEMARKFVDEGEYVAPIFRNARSSCTSASEQDSTPVQPAPERRTVYQQTVDALGFDPLGQGEPGPRCRYCGADCSNGRSYDGANLYACPDCSEKRAHANRLAAQERARAWMEG